MVAPLVTNNSLINQRYLYVSKTGFKQAPPHNLITPYTRTSAKMIQSVGDRGSQYNAAKVAGWYRELKTAQDADTLSKAYDQLKNRISDRASLGVSLAELGQSTTMIAERSTQIFRFARELRRGNLVGATKQLRLSAVPKRASVKKSFANNYLEFHFGWAPLVGDIFNAVKVLQSPVNSIYASATAKSSQKSSWNEYVSDNRDGYPFLMRRGITWSGAVRLGCEVRVNNSNLWLANQLGLVNPAVIAFELIPFSFVADWFINVGQFLSTGTDFYGLTLDNAYTTHIAKGLWEYRWNYHPTYGSAALHQYEVVSMGRGTGISKPGLFVRPFKVWGWRRAAAAVSLVTQQLAKK